MSTRSNIIVKRGDGKYACIYCHFDGYLSGVGQTLLDYYNSQELAERLTEKGDMSSLGDTIAECSYYVDSGENPREVAALVEDTLQEVWPGADAWTEYHYVWQDGHWWVSQDRVNGHANLKRLDGFIVRHMIAEACDGV